MGPTSRIIGVGNAWRGDDGVGPYVIRALQGRIAAHRLHAVDGDVSELLPLFSHCEDVILIDALDGEAAGLRPGTRLCLEADDDRLAHCGSGVGTHAFGVPEAIRLARSLGELPQKLRIVAVVGASFGEGRGLSPRVMSSAERVAKDLWLHCRSRID